MTEKLFSEQGFTIVKNAIDSKTLENIHNNLYFALEQKEILPIKNNDLYNVFCEKLKKNKKTEYDFTLPIFQYLLFKNSFDDLLKSKKLYDSLTGLLGKDLSYCTDPSITVNIPEKASSKKNYLFKDWHQEIWSGANPSTIQIWTPLIHKKSTDGQMELIMDSHKWGHIPHRNRKPTNLPRKFETYKIKLEYGDVLVFSTLLVHRSIKSSYPRMALPMLLKNFKQIDYSFQNNRNWKIFSYSELTKIERVLGNHFLSPYRNVK